jgi:hypothetical protein
LDTLHAIAYQPTQPITSLKANLPYALQKVVDRCLQKKPEDRYQDLREAVADLKNVKRQVDSGVTGGMPLLDQVRIWLGGLTTKGIIWAALAGTVVGGLLFAWLLGSVQRDWAGLLTILVIGAFLFRRFRNRPQREAKKFVKKVSMQKEVRLITLQHGQFTVVVESPTAKTYLRLNALLTSANEKLFHGDPMTLVIREGLPQEEIRKILSTPGVQFLRDEPKAKLKGKAI